MEDTVAGEEPAGEHTPVRIGDAAARPAPHQRRVGAGPDARYAKPEPPDTVTVTDELAETVAGKRSARRPVHHARRRAGQRDQVDGDASASWHGRSDPHQLKNPDTLSWPRARAREHGRDSSRRPRDQDEADKQHDREQPGAHTLNYTASRTLVPTVARASEVWAVTVSGTARALGPHAPYTRSRNLSRSVIGGC